MSFTEYTLPPIYNNPVGIVKWYLYVDSSFPALTIPTRVNIMNLGEILERLDAIAGELGLENVDIDIAEDYSTYPNGFWHHLINDFSSTVLSNFPSMDFDIMFTLMEGVNEVYVFRGKIYRKNIIETEHYLDVPDAPIKPVRGLKFKLVSPLVALDNIAVAQTGYVNLVLSDYSDDNNFKNINLSDILTIGGGDCTIQAMCRGYKTSFGDPSTIPIYWKILNSGTSYVDGTFTTDADGFGRTHSVTIKTVTTDLCTEVLKHEESGYVTAYATTVYLVKLQSVFATMIQLAYGDSYDISTVVDNTTDLLIYDNVSAYGVFTNIYMSSSFFNKTLNGDGSTVFYGAYSGRFKTAWELFKHLGRQFGAIPEYSFGTAMGLKDSTPANNKHRIILKSRGRSGATVTMTGKISNNPPSEFVSNSSYISRNMKITNFYHDEWSGWCIDNKILNKTLAAAVTFKDTEFDIKIDTDFYPTPDLTTFFVGFQQVATGSLYIKMSTGVFTPAVSVKWWDYTLGAETVFPNMYGWTSFALIIYLFNRMRDGRVQYTRDYRNLLVNNGSTNSICNNKICMRHTINDGTITRTFYATELGKSLFENKTRVVWVEE